MMEMLFGRQKTPAEMLRQHQRSLQKAQREMDREKTKLDASEKKLIADIKKAAKANQMSACKIMAKDLVRTRRYSQKFQAMKTQLQAVSLRIQTLRSNQQMSEAMKGATKAMKSMNRQMNLPAMQKIMSEFEKESEIMDMKEDMMNDVIDDTMAEENDEEESDEIVNQVLDEIGISLDQSLVDTPNSIERVSQKEKILQAEEMESSNDAALQARLDNLRRE
ncbi:charged multivesicular body protein 2a [Rhizophagus irregularis]|uniref:Charged multivesicular body protein 2a n=4 Tax=Rhizophagus irregularis TaxID=588596 RepID=A0A2I1EF97_9GLOM|nr:putative vacuolar sorting protein DID4 [Rhizophagus irregularis DAOM 181602=DAOM 197198]EXX51937.1 Did4p [Rhizophagus irregularis DAOM 197198w]PKC10886.1 charged multivesicular body protein 2a [Rhizophagus irregularis]RGB29826.1 charged multivesicular body protein 2a [Rhizophagus diaphanus] [Rhizophagus sp. MUCL 43196]PKC55946.1 charged multivesicular body protein 2a [Rhizophagus irregularis]PKK73920.1 charged multivesicular body protein 2a [Rhizophagus irregularis]|eukprot:XP_025172118.1 putative vacuolar sorting protein DID4 [Rhizophagus irregularis DAOM 181602=DAOM 197198]